MIEVKVRVCDGYPLRLTGFELFNTGHFTKSYFLKIKNIRCACLPSSGDAFDALGVGKRAMPVKVAFNTESPLEFDGLELIDAEVAKLRLVNNAKPESQFLLGIVLGHVPSSAAHWVEELGNDRDVLGNLMLVGVELRGCLEDLLRDEE